MAEEHLEVRRVKWCEVFDFTQIFRGFRLAIHPSKLMLAFAALVLIGLGGFCLDCLWSLWGGYVDTNEIAGYVNPQGAGLNDYTQGQTFAEWKQGQNANRLKKAVQLLSEAKSGPRKTFADFMAQLKGPNDSAKEALKDSFTKFYTDYNNKNALPTATADDLLKAARDKNESASSKLSAASTDFGNEMSGLETLLSNAYDDASKTVDGLGKDDKGPARDALAKNYSLALRELAELKAGFQRNSNQVRGQKIFRCLGAYERDCVSEAINAAWRLNFTGGLEQYAALPSPNEIRPIAVTVNQSVPTQAAQERGCGVVYWTLMAANGVRWLLSEHWVYGAIFLLWTLAVWALFGGAIHRIAALHATRDEKISFSQALKFSASRFLSFFTAPLIPLFIIFVLGALLILGALLGNLWGFGAILMGVMFLLALLLGLVIAFVLVGLIGGVALMYPTIAVEGSDSFDAISRSFSYVFARPWRTAFYGAIAAVYGALCYLFVRFFVYLALSSVHFFVKIGVFTGGQRLGANADRVDVMWNSPSFASLQGVWNWPAMTTCEAIGAGFIWIYVAVLTTLVSAFLLTYASSVMTIIYTILRQKVDATDMDDVYIEEAEPAPAAPVSADDAKAAPAPEASKPADAGESKPPTA